MARIQPPTPPYLGPAKYHGAGQTLKPCKRIVIHGTVSPCVPGGARAIARYFKTTVTRPSSAHYVIDPTEVVQVVGDHQIAYHAPPNTDTIGVEHCDPVSGPSNRWNDPAHQAMLKLSAQTVARLCLAFDVPIRHVTAVGLRLGRRGITGHYAVSLAWRQTSHTDPGAGFPWRRYIKAVKAEAAKLQGVVEAPVTPVPVLPPAHVQPCTMVMVTSNIKNNPDLPRPQVVHDIDAVRRLGGVLLWQEIAEQDDRDDLRKVCPDTEWEHVGLEQEVPLSFWRENWQVLDHGTELLHPGKAHVSPSRYVQWAKVQRKGSPEVPPVVVMNTHYVSGAFSHAGQLAEDWRDKMWNVAHAAQSTLVQRFLDQGLTVVGGGDFNRTGAWEGFAPGHRWLVHGGYDHLWTCEAPKGARVRLESTGTLGTDKLYTDHAARWAHITLLPLVEGVKR